MRARCSTCGPPAWFGLIDMRRVNVFAGDYGGSQRVKIPDGGGVSITNTQNSILAMLKLCVITEAQVFSTYQTTRVSNIHTAPSPLKALA